LRIFSLLALVMALVVMLLFFLNWTYIYNTEYGVEDPIITGFNCLAAGVSGNYTGTNKAIGNMAHPYYSQAQSYALTLSHLTVAAFFILLASIAAFALAAVRNKGYFTKAGFLLSLAVTVLLFISYSVALSMKHGEILSTYCQGNPKCSIRSEIILPALLSLFSLALPVTEIIRRALLKKQYKTESK